MRTRSICSLIDLIIPAQPLPTRSHIPSYPALRWRTSSMRYCPSIFVPLFAGLVWSHGSAEAVVRWNRALLLRDARFMMCGRLRNVSKWSGVQW